MSIRKLKKELKKYSEVVTFTFPNGVCYSIVVNNKTYGFYPYSNEVEVMDSNHIMYEDDIEYIKIKQALKELRK